MSTPARRARPGGTGSRRTALDQEHRDCLIQPERRADDNEPGGNGDSKSQGDKLQIPSFWKVPGFRAVREMCWNPKGCFSQLGFVSISAESIRNGGCAEPSGRKPLKRHVRQERGLCQAPPLQPQVQGRAQDAKTVGHASPKIDRRGLFEILRRAGNLAHPEAEIKCLHNHLVVEDKIVRAAQQRQPLQQLPAPCPITAVVLRHLVPIRIFSMNVSPRLAMYL